MAGQFTDGHDSGECRSPQDEVDLNRVSCRELIEVLLFNFVSNNSRSRSLAILRGGRIIDEESSLLFACFTTNYLPENILKRRVACGGDLNHEAFNE